MLLTLYSEPTLPVYALDPSLDITVSGALFTFIYLPLLALACLFGLIFAKTNGKFLASPKKHVKKKRRGMKYITKTLSINLSSQRQRFNVSKSEKIKLVEKPSWLVKKKRLLPSPDISQHHILLLLGLCLMSSGYLVLSGGGNYDGQIVTRTNGIDLVLGLVLISIGSALCIVSNIDSFINGIVSNLNQTQITYVVINISILIGPLTGGLMLDLAGNEFTILSKYWSYAVTLHFVIYSIFLLIRYFVKCIGHCAKRKKLERQQKEQREKSLLHRQECIAINMEKPSGQKIVCSDSVLSAALIGNESVSSSSDSDDLIVGKRKQKKAKQQIAEKAYIYGTDLRHLCWWKRGVNVRFPYAQWMESGWTLSSTKHKMNVIKNRNKRRQKPQKSANYCDL